MIVMDLEWNHGTVDKQLLLEGRTLRFEIIQIGAVQVDNLGNICKTFERLVMPCVHRTIMPKVIELTGITDRSLKGQQGFVQVWQDFCRWAGEEEEIAFWGNCDKAVLLSNLLYHKIDGGESLQMYDLQAMFDCAFLKGGQQTSLSAAIEQLGLPPYGSYHSALSDAVNAANIMRSLGGESFVYKNQVKVLERLRLRSARRKRKEQEEGNLLMERTLTNITDTAQVKQLLALELSRQLDNGVQEVVPGFYRNHKKIWAYQSGEEFFKVTSHSRPALSGEGKDFVLRFFKIDRPQVVALRAFSKRAYQTTMRQSQRAARRSRKKGS